MTTNPPGTAGVSADVVFCLPHAGGGMHTYLSWTRALAGAFAWVPVDYAGHFTRDDEPPYATFAEAVEDLAALVESRAGGRVVGLFGHSLGGSLAFEVARRLERTGTCRVAAVVVSSAEPPSELKATRQRYFALDDLQLLQHLQELEDSRDPDPRRRALLSQALPLIRSDYRLHHSYRPEPGAEIRARLHICSGTDEPAELCRRLDHWHRHGPAPVLRHTFPGGHFYWRADPDGITRTLTDVFAPGPGSDRGPGPRPAAAITTHGRVAECRR